MITSDNALTHYAEYFDRVKQTLDQLDISQIELVVDAMMECYENRRRIFVFGNGGSGATASHVGGDFMKGISYGLEKRFKVSSLNDNMPGISAISNDLTYDEIFIEQLKGHVDEGDLVIGISGSGNSLNVLKALEYAQSKKATTVIFCGYKGGKAKEMADLVVHAPVMDMEVTEDVHMIIFHTIKQALIARTQQSGVVMGERYEERISQ